MEKSITEVVHESVKGLRRAGLVNAETMHIFDTLCLPVARDLSPKLKAKVRKRVSNQIIHKLVP